MRFLAILKLICLFVLVDGVRSQEEPPRNEIKSLHEYADLFKDAELRKKDPEQTWTWEEWEKAIPGDVRESIDDYYHLLNESDDVDKWKDYLEEGLEGDFVESRSLFGFLANSKMIACDDEMARTQLEAIRYLKEPDAYKESFPDLEDPTADLESRLLDITYARSLEVINLAYSLEQNNLTLSEETLWRREQALALSLSELLRHMRLTCGVDEAYFHEMALLNRKTLTRISDLTNMVVAIARENTNEGGYDFLGTGFVLERKAIVTCAHVLTKELYDYTNGPKGRVRWEDVRIFLPDGDGRFSDEVSFSAIPGKLIPEYDAVFFEFEKPETETAQRVLNKYLDLLDRVCAVNYAKVDTNLASGALYGVAALSNKPEEVRDGDIGEVKWIQPGRIVFPHRARRPADQGSTDLDADIAFLRAWFNQFWGMIWNKMAYDPKGMITNLQGSWQLIATPEDAAEVRYRQINSAGDCTLKYRPDASTYLQHLARDRSMMIDFIGTDLITRAGNSGAPIFELKEGKPLIVGVHSGRTGRDQPSWIIAPTLHNCQRTIPFHLIWQAGLKEFLEE